MGLGLGLALHAAGADWPTYLRDNLRSGSSDEQFVTPLLEQWVRLASHPSELAWAEKAVERRDLCDDPTSQFRHCLSRGSRGEGSLLWFLGWQGTYDPKTSPEKGEQAPLLNAIEVVREGRLETRQGGAAGGG